MNCWNARALVRAIRHGELDRIEIPDAPLDVLAQQIVAACAAEDWQEDDLFALGPARVIPTAILREKISTKLSLCFPMESPRAADDMALICIAIK